MKHIVNTFLPTIILLAFMLSGCDRDKSKRSDTSSAESVDVAMPQVDSVVLHKQYPAYVSAEAESDIVARVNGYIRQKFFKDGDWLPAGAPLFAIESTTYADQVSKAEAALKTAEASYDYASKQYEAMKRLLKAMPCRKWK